MDRIEEKNGSKMEARIHSFLIIDATVVYSLWIITLRTFISGLAWNLLRIFMILLSGGELCKKRLSKEFCTAIHS